MVDLALHVPIKYEYFSSFYNKLSYNTSFSPKGHGNVVLLWVSLCLFSSLGTLNSRDMR